MPHNPHPSILDKDLAEQASEKLREPLWLLEDMAHYGSNLIIRTWDNTPKGMGDVVIVNHLLRLIVTHLDGLHTLLKTASGPTSLLQLRSLLETSLLLDWMDLGDAETKGTYMAVSIWRKRRIAAQAFIPGTPENVEFLQAISGTVTSEQEARARAEISAINQILSQADLAPIDAAFQSLASRHEPDWTVVYHHATEVAAGTTNPPRLSIRGIAKEVGRGREYRYFYSKLSNETHGSALGGSVGFPGSTVVTHNVRRLHEFDWIFRTAVGLALRSYRVVLKRYRPGETSLEQNYLEHWKPIWDRDWKVTEVTQRQSI